METLYRLVSGLTAGFIALFAPIGPLVACAMAFIGIDFLSGVAASRAAARRKGHTWYFESCEAWRTVLKLGLTVTRSTLFPYTTLFRSAVSSTSCS